MNTPREQISIALFNLLQGANGSGNNQFQFKKFQRAPMVWAGIGVDDMPAAFLFKPLEQHSSDEAYGVVKYVLHYILLVYLRAEQESDTIGETLENQILDALDAAINQNGPPQTLGGLVNNVWSEGPCDLGLNALESQMWFAVAIKVETGS